MQKPYCNYISEYPYTNTFVKAIKTINSKYELELFLDDYGDIEKQSTNMNYQGWRLIHFICRYAKPMMVIEFLKLGRADITARTYVIDYVSCIKQYEIPKYKYYLISDNTGKTHMISMDDHMGWCPIHFISAYRPYTVINFILKMDIDIDVEIPIHKATAAHFILNRSNVTTECVKLLLERGVDFSKREAYTGNTPLDFAFLAGSLDNFKYLCCHLENIYTFDFKENNYSKQLKHYDAYKYYDCWYSNHEYFYERENPEPCEYDHNKKKTYHDNLLFSDEFLFNEIIKNDAYDNKILDTLLQKKQVKISENNLCKIINDNKIDLIKKLIDYHIECSDNLFLGIIIKNGTNDLIKYGIQNINVNNNHNRVTALHFACHNNKADVVKMIIDKAYFDINYLYYYNWTYLHVACRYSNEEIIRMIADKFENVNARTFLGWQAIHFVAKHSTLEIVRYLIDKGANPTTLTYDLNTPVLLAYSSGILKPVLEKLKRE